MKSLVESITDNQLKKVRMTKPKDVDALKKLIKKLIEQRGPQADLNDVDISKVKSMRYLFAGTDFNGDISKWEVKEVLDFSSMFENSKFNGDLSRWKVHNANWMNSMFENSEFNQDISNWIINTSADTSRMFLNSKISSENKPGYRAKLSRKDKLIFTDINYKEVNYPEAVERSGIKLRRFLLYTKFKGKLYEAFADQYWKNYSSNEIGGYELIIEGVTINLNEVITSFDGIRMKFAELINQKYNHKK